VSVASSMNTGPAITFACLAHQPIWVAWKQEPRRGKRTTLPYDPVTGRLATSNDSTTWATRQEADGWAATNSADGVGLMLTPIDDAIIGEVDLAGCRDPNTETIEPRAQAVASLKKFS
jgi:primase-polymerase (primpol)-like protein